MSIPVNLEPPGFPTTVIGHLRGRWVGLPGEVLGL